MSSVLDNVVPSLYLAAVRTSSDVRIGGLGAAEDVQ